MLFAMLALVLVDGKGLEESTVEVEALLRLSKYRSKIIYEWDGPQVLNPLRYAVPWRYHAAAVELRDPLGNGDTPEHLPIDAAAIQTINGLRRLESIKINSKIDINESLKIFTPPPSLVRVELSGPRLTSDGIAGFLNTASLQMLVLYNLGVDDRIVPAILRQKNLQLLDVSSTRLTVHGIGKLGKCRKLVQLNVNGTECDSTAAARCLAIPGLVQFDMRWTEISEMEAAALRRRFPGTNILFAE